MWRDKYLGWLIDCLDENIAVVVHCAVQNAATLDGECERTQNVRLEHVGCVPVKRHRRTVRRFLPGKAQQSTPSQI